MSNKIKNDEKVLKGGLIINNGNVEFDDTSLRIGDLISDYLIRIADDKTGWDVLFQDPNDNLYWELTYPNCELQGGGAPLLSEVSYETSKTKYNI